MFVDIVVCDDVINVCVCIFNEWVWCDVLCVDCFVWDGDDLGFLVGVLFFVKWNVDVVGYLMVVGLFVCVVLLFVSVDVVMVV